MKRPLFWFATGLAGFLLAMSEPPEPEPTGTGPMVPVPSQELCDLYPERADPPGCGRYRWR